MPVLTGQLEIEPTSIDRESLFAQAAHYEIDFADVRGPSGQAHAHPSPRRAARPPGPDTLMGPRRPIRPADPAKPQAGPDHRNRRRAQHPNVVYDLTRRP